MNFVALEPVVAGVQFLTAPSFSSETSFLFTVQFIYTILFVLIIFTAMVKVWVTGVKLYVLQEYGNYNGKTVSTEEEWGIAKEEISHDFTRTICGLAAPLFLFWVLSFLNPNLLN